MNAIQGHLTRRARLRIVGVAVVMAAAALLLAMSRGAPASPPAATASGGRVTVDINHFKYHPPTLRIAKGTRVVFSNSAHIAHTATDRGAFDTGHIRPGRSVAVRFTHRGTFAYHCTIHHFMHGTIVVR